MVTILMSKSVLTEQELKAIGHVVVESTYCEHLVEEIIWGLCGLKEDQGKFLTSNVQMNNRLEVMSSLWKQKLSDDKKLKNLTTLVSNLKLANNDRNTIVHGHWNYPKLSIADWWRDEKYPPAKAKKRRLNSEPLEFSASDIFKTAERISDLTGELWEFAESEKILS